MNPKRWKKDWIQKLIQFQMCDINKEKKAYNGKYYSEISPSLNYGLLCAFHEG